MGDTERGDRGFVGTAYWDAANRWPFSQEKREFLKPLPLEAGRGFLLSPLPS